MSQPNQSNTKKKGTKKQPADWPANSPVDLAIHDLPHESSTLECWNQNCHLATIKGRHFSLFASFTRMVIGTDEHTGEAIYTHAVSWALTDTDKQKYYSDSLADRTDAFVNNTTFQLAIDHNSFQKIQEGKYQLKLQNPVTGVGCALNFMPFVNPVLHGNNGVVAGTRGENLFYYFIPACEVNGTITLPNEAPLDVEGCGWYDHKFGKPTSTAKTKATKQQLTSNWFSIQLDNSWQITAYELVDTDKQPAARWAVLINPDGNAVTVPDFQLTPGDTFTSARTFIAYPVQWRLTIAEHDIDLYIQASLPDQEFITVVDKPAFWQGRVQTTGRFGKKTVNGLGYVENC